MKRTALYIALGVCVVAALVLIVFKKQSTEFDKTVTFDPKTKNPYDFTIAYNELPVLFNNCTIQTNREPPSEWYDSDSVADGKTIFFVITQHFNANHGQCRNLMNFVKAGNQVFISTPVMGDAAKEFFGLGEQAVYNYNVVNGFFKDSGVTYLNSPPFAKDTSYLNPGFNFTAHFTDIDSMHYYVLGRDDGGFPNLIKVNAGKGSFYFQSNPFLFTNYFLLYQSNLSYFEKLASLMPQDEKKIIWDQYFVYKLEDNQKADDPSPFHELFSISSFAWALWLALALLVLYIVLFIKRMQRFIPVLAKPSNDSLDFTKTIGRLYFEKGDHTNMAKKMATYLLEHIRNRYFINTNTLDEEFIKSLASKSGYSEEQVKELAGNLAYIQAGHKVSEEQLANIYQSFSKFYKYTA